MPKDRKLVGVVGAFAVFAVFAAGVFAMYWVRMRAAALEAAGNKLPEREQTSGPLSPVSLRAADAAPRESDYTGSRACASCHQEIYDQYFTSPMSQSFASVQEAAVVEDYGTAHFAPPGRQHYSATRDEASWLHTETTVDEKGEPVLKRSEEIHFVVGSGKRGRAYLFSQHGMLYQSPIGWYSQSQKWDLSPGYSAERHQRFSRRIGDGCLYCHAGRMHGLTEAENRYAEPIVAEAAIGCERCHGPGQRHIDFHEGAAGGAAPRPARDPIVNPSRLPPDRRESVCNQCHLLGRSVLPRCGRGFYDFRPGDLLEDVFVVLSQPDDTSRKSAMQAVSQVEQMRASNCYLASQGALGCTSCHDPHVSPSVEQRAEHYRLRCLACHETKGCSADSAVRAAPPANDSCIHCHMPTEATHDVPHTSLTDHRVLREPGKSGAKGAKPLAPGAADWVVFDNADRRLPAAEVERATGIALMTEAWRKGDKHLAAEAQQYLLKVLNAPLHQARVQVLTVDDAPLLEELGAGFMLLRELDSADACWKRLLELKPQSETALLGLAKTADERADIPAYANWVNRLAQLRPDSEEVLTLQVQVMVAREDLAGAARLAERVLELNPGKTYQRKWLVDVYRRLGEKEKARHHQELLERIGGAPAETEKP